MDTLDNFGSMRSVLNSVYRQSTRFNVKFRDGTAPVDWVENGVHRAMDLWQTKLTLLWLLSDASHTLILSDLEITPGENTTVIEARLKETGVLQGSNATLADIQTAMSERNRPKLINFFRTDRENGGLNVQSRLGAIRNLMDDARDAAAVAVPPSGDITYFTRTVSPGGVSKTRVKTLSEIGADATALADALDLLAAEVASVIRVT